MKKLLLGTVALAALGAGVTANAAELAVPRRAAYVAPVVYHNWTGCHLGGMVGDAWGTNRGFNNNGSTFFFDHTGVSSVPAGTLVDSFSMGGFNGGFYGGCDYQFGAWLVGIESDWSNLNKEGQNFITPALVAADFNNERTMATKERWFATLRGRLGFAVDKWLFYATGGAVWMRIDSSEWDILTPGNTTSLQTDTRTGWTVGVGTEYAVGWGWVARTEYLFIDIPRYTTFNGLGNGVHLADIDGTFVNVDTGPIYNHVWRFGLHYKFGNYAAAAPVTK